MHGRRHFARAVVAGALLSAPSVGLAGEPSFGKIPDEVTIAAGSPLHVALDGADPSGHALRFEATSSNELVEAVVLTGNRSMRIRVAGFGTMVFQLFEQRVPRITERIIALAESGFYDGVIFHRVIDRFVIQAGDPTGTGAGGSGLEPVDDQFHVDLQHNRTGILSMAKAGDDTNDSQFFITEDPQRHLDFEHSVFGVLVEGESVRQAISNVPTGIGDRPLEDVVIESVEIFEDRENAVVMLKAEDGVTGDAEVTVVATDPDGLEARQTFHVTVVPDTVNSNPFLADIPPVVTDVDTPVTFQLQAIDVEGDPAFFLGQDELDLNGLPVPVRAHPDLRYTVDFETGLVTVTPTNGLEGVHRITVATALFVNAVDYQVVPIYIGVEPPAAEEPE